MKHKLFTLATILGLNAFANAASTTVPMHFTNMNHAYIYADIDGVKHYPMVVDTGASVGILPQSFKDKLKITDEHITKHKVTGGTEDMVMEFANIGITQIGTEQQRNIQYIFQDMDKLESQKGAVPGIIGYGYLTNYCVDFNFDQKTFSLIDTGCNAQITAGMREVPFEIKNNFVWLKSNFAGIEVDVLLDTGAHHSFINSQLFNQLSNVKTGENEKFSGLTDAQQSRTEIFDVYYQLGGHPITEKRMFTSDMHVFDVLGYGEKPILLLGLNHFIEGRLIVDYINKKLYF